MTFATASDNLSRAETDDLISSENVNSTPVYSPKGERLGSVKYLMIGKRDGRARFAVLTFGGLFAIGERFYPLPWDALVYDEELAGYVVDRTRDQLEHAPSYERGEEPTYDRSFGERVYTYYGIQ